jgi:hypothetical protein
MIPHHTLDTPRRFHEPWEAAASLGLRTGDPDAVGVYAEHQRLHTAHPALVAAQVAEAHTHHTTAGRSVAITVNTAQTARAINREIQWLSRSGRAPGAGLHDGTTAHPGDQIATRRNNPRLRTDRGEQVRNRQTWTVDSVGSDGVITAQHNQRGTATLPADYVAEHVELGWAVTGYGNQGDTVDIGIAVLEPTSSRNHADVAMTRGRQANHALIVDPTGTADPAERLAEIITRPASAESALAARSRLHRAAGVEPPCGDELDLVTPTEAEPTTSRNELEATSTELDEDWLKVQKRLDRLQHATPDRGRETSLDL